MAMNDLHSNILNLITSINANTLFLIVLLGAFLIIARHLRLKKISNNESTIKEWTNGNTIKLYGHLRMQAWIVELSIIAIGAYTASQMGEGLIIISIYSFIVLLCEVSKLHIVESLVRFPRISLIILAVPALAISITMTGESLLRVTNDISSESDKGISLLADEIKESSEIKLTIEDLIKDLKREKKDLENQLQKSQLLRIGKEDTNQLNEEIQNLKKQKEEIILGNNSLEKENLKRVMIEHDASIYSVRSAINNQNKSYSLGLKTMRDAKFRELTQAGFLVRKSEIREKYNESLSKLDLRNQVIIDRFSKEENLIKLRKGKINSDLQALLELTPQNRRAINKIDKGIDELKIEKEKLKNKGSGFIDELEKKKESISQRIKLHQTEIYALKDQDIAIKKKINKLKTSNFFYGMASIFYHKEASDVSDEEYKEFLNYFIGISAVGLAFMPPLLFGLSVLVEKSLVNEANRISYKDFILTVCKNIKESCLFISNSANSILKVVHEKKKQRVESNSKRKQYEQEIKYAQRETKNLQECSKHEVIQKDQENFEKNLMAIVKNNHANIKDNLMEELVTTIKKEIEKGLENKSIKSKVTQNYLSKEFLNNLLGEK